uniref:tRNA-uridine aminocarboxypropyltransferase n=2 Tax=Hordeum vulgare subsp. vulgare TaxID=112509 RepID=A0A8I6YRX5_HORVV
MPIFSSNSIGISQVQTGLAATRTKLKFSSTPNRAAPPTSPPMAMAESETDTQSDAHLREPGQRRRRPVCGVCTKPLRVCLCGRLRGPPLDTAVGVTVLQHPTEAHHPLSSVRVARLGLRNLAVAQVADVAHRASFLLTTNLGLGGEETGNVEAGAAAIGEAWTVETMDDKCSIAYTEKQLRIDVERGVGANPKIRWLPRCSSLAELAVSNGFTVTKTQENKPRRSTGDEASPSPELQHEYSIAIPPHSALLFPCQRATTIDAASDCQVLVKHLIVLDGTWAKAHRMYHENPWLQLVPHVMVEADTVSLYGEVRHEPKAGCLSTVESIVVAMKELGEDETGLDRVLAVFESMIADQRRCKDENWKPKQKSQ